MSRKTPSISRRVILFPVHNIMIILFCARGQPHNIMERNSFGRASSCATILCRLAPRSCKSREFSPPKLPRFVFARALVLPSFPRFSNEDSNRTAMAEGRGECLFYPSLLCSTTFVLGAPSRNAIFSCIFHAENLGKKSREVKPT